MTDAFDQTGTFAPSLACEPRQPNRAPTPTILLNGLIVTVSALAIAGIDEVLRASLPASEHVMLPLLVLGAGAGLRFVGLKQKRPPMLANATASIAGAMAELEPPPRGQERHAAPVDEPETGSAYFSATGSNASTERAVAELNQYHVFTDILSEQMLSVSASSEQTAAGILANLADVDKKIKDLLSFIQDSGSNEQAVKVVSQIEQQMSECQGLLDDFVATQLVDARDNRQQRSQIAAETGRVFEILESVDGIARQTTMLSFNVSIEAARVGDAGRGFSVIGDEIRRLADEARGLSKEVRGRVETLTRTVTVDLEQRSELREQTQSAAVANITETLRALTDNMTTLITHQRDILSKVESENESVARPILEMMGSIQFQDIIRQQIEQLVRMAGMVGEHMRAISSMLGDAREDVGLVSLSQKLEAQFETYVMDRQRQTHRSVTGAAGQDSGPRIELF